MKIFLKIIENLGSLCEKKVGRGDDAGFSCGQLGVLSRVSFILVLGGSREQNQVRWAQVTIR